MIEELARLLDDAVATGHPPAACACVLVDGEVVHESAHGDARTDSVFDVASVTKIATTMVIAREVADGALELDAPAARWLGAFAARGKGQVTVRELLGHRSGLPAWAPLFVEVMRDPRTASLFAQGAADRGAWSIARELGSRGITANVVSPGLVETDITAEMSEEQVKAYIDATPLGRTTTAEEVAKVIRWLAGDEAAYITGAVIPVDGGFGMGY